MDYDHDSEGFAVYSDLKFLYQIGRIWAESGKYLEEGILCLDDYINLMDFFNPAGKAYDMQSELSEHLNDAVHFSKCKALYLVGLIFYQVKDYPECERFLSQVKMDLKEIGEIDKYKKWEQILEEVHYEIYGRR